MRMLILLPACLLCIIPCFGQYVDTFHPNGLLYSDTAMHRLALIVDSLNREFERSVQSTAYYSKYQARGYHFDMRKGDIGSALRDIKNNISFEDFIKKYPDCTISGEHLIVKYKYRY